MLVMFNLQAMITKGLLKENENELDYAVTVSLVSLFYVAKLHFIYAIKEVSPHTKTSLRSLCL